MKKALLIIGAILVIGVCVFAYETRPLTAPTTDINSEVEHLEETSAVSDSTTSASEVKTVRIVGAKSKAQFSLNEVLSGKPVLVIGTTNQVAGDIQVKATAPAKLTIGQIKIDARTLKTDSEKRNGALGRMILKSEDAGNQYIVFKATTVTGVPTSITVGKEFPYTITGDLTIKGVTKSATWKAKSTLGADGSLTGTADTIITYGDYGISVPDLPFLADVEKTTKLSIFIVAQ